MKKNYSYKKDNAAIYRQSLISGYDFVSFRLEGVKNGTIAPTNTATRRRIANLKNITLKQVEIDYLESCVNYVATNPTVEVLSNSSQSAMKATVTLDGHHMNPLQQAKDSSRRVVEYRHVANEMQGLFDMTKTMDLKSKAYNFEGNKIYAYSGVISFTNSNRFNLVNDVKALNQFASKLWKKLKDAHYRNSATNRLAVADGETGFASPVGMLMANEMTINTDKLQAMDSKGLYHPHIHFILFTDKELSDGVSDDIFNIWNNLTGAKYRTDKKAFTFARTYSKSAGKDSSVTASLKEVTKYLMDPSKWEMLALKKVDSTATRQFKIGLFAEYFNAYSEMKRVRTYGLLRDAQGFVNRFSDFENASIYKQSDILPDILTQLNELKYDKKMQKYTFNRVRLLTDDEILHENKTFLSKTLVDKGFKDLLNTFVGAIIGDLKTEKDRLFAEYFKHKQFHSTVNELQEKLNETLKELGYEKHKMDRLVFNEKAFKSRFNESFEVGNYDHFEKYRSLKIAEIKNNTKLSVETIKAIYSAIELFGKACDIKMLITALNNKMHSTGTSVFYSRKDIDARIFEKRKSYRSSLRSDSEQKDFDTHGLFYQSNGMTLPMDGRTHEEFSLFVEKSEIAEWFELFRVPQGSRDQIEQRMFGITINGVAA